MRPQPSSRLREVARIAARQHGVVSHGQLLVAGVSRDVIKGWLVKGLLHREFRGVYRLGHRAPSIEAHYLAAVLACGPNAFLAGHAAAFLYAIVRGPAPPPQVICLTTRKHPGMTTRRPRKLDPADTSTYRHIPITTIPRTLVDIAAHLPLDALARAHHEADVKHNVAPSAIEAALARRQRIPGAENLRAVIHGDTDLLLSRLETNFKAVLKSHGLPKPITNRKRGAHYVDCRWPTHPLTVELDSFRFHHTRHAWEQDRERERAARARGDEFRRYTWRDVVEDPVWMLGDLRRLLRPSHQPAQAPT